MSRIIGYRGLVPDGGEQKISLRTKSGKTGYRIVKFQIFPQNFNVTDEYNMKLFKKSQGVTAAAPYATTTVDFSDNTLLAAAYFENGSGVGSEGSFSDTVVFDREIFNQDIYIVSVSQSGATCNYYFELETVDLSDTESTQLTLKNLRAVASRFA